MQKDNNFYASFNNIEKESIKRAFENNGWKSVKANWHDFKLLNTWSELTLEGETSQPLLNGAVEFCPQKLMILDKIFNDLKGEYQYEFYDQTTNVIFQTKPFS